MLSVLTQRAWRAFGRGALVALVMSYPAAFAATAVPAGVSTTARQVYAQARDKLLQVRVVLKAARSQAVIGSGFLAGANGLVITNYHVVSRFALDPAAYSLEYIRGDGSRGELNLLTVDVVNDLAALRMAGSKLPYFDLDVSPITQGERVFSIGNPLDLGFTIVEGTYNGVVDGSFHERIHFSGALNPGMSGGPALTLAGKVFGVNVAQSRDGELVSFLIPGKHVGQILARARTLANDAPHDWSREINDQLLGHQARLMKALNADALPGQQLGGYRVPDKPARFGRCWAYNDQSGSDRYQLDGTNCGIDSSLYIDEEVQVGDVNFEHQLFQSKNLNSLRFYSLYAQRFAQRGALGGRSKQHYTRAECKEDFLKQNDIVFRAVLCTRAYKKFTPLYNFGLTLATVDQARMGLQSRLQLTGVTFDNGLAFVRRYLEAIRWQK